MKPQGRDGNLRGPIVPRKDQMTPLSIDRFRRLTLALIALLFAGLAFSSISSAEDFLQFFGVPFDQMPDRGLGAEVDVAGQPPSRCTEPGPAVEV